MTEMIGTIKEILAAGKRPLLGVGVMAWVLLLLPTPATEFLGMTQFLATYRPYVGLAALLGPGLFASYLLTDLAAWGRRQIEARLGYSRLRKLTPPEQEMLADFIANHTNNLEIWTTNGTVWSLVDKGLLRPARIQTRDIDATEPFILESWAYEYLMQHPQLVRLPGKFADLAARKPVRPKHAK